MPFVTFHKNGQTYQEEVKPDTNLVVRARDADKLAAAVAAVKDAALSPLYSDTLQPAIAAALLKRPDVAKRAGEMIVRNAKRSGMFGRLGAKSGAAAAIQLLPYLPGGQ